MHANLTHQLYALSDRNWYESLACYQPDDDLLQIVRSLLPASWSLTCKGGWFGVLPANPHLPQQGWKIHVSATIKNCKEILQLTAAFCIDHEIAFKLALDTRLVMLSTSPPWAREASGKFITIYPLSEAAFCSTIEALYTILRDFKGPYILSDKRYKDAKVLYYRYGGIAGLSTLTLSGKQSHLLLNPQGEPVSDHRTPYWNPPAWVTDPFQ